MLHKIGFSLDPRKRVKMQEKDNNERYTLCAMYQTKFHHFLEYAAHKMFQDSRVVKSNCGDGQTEWFLGGLEELEAGINKIRTALYYIHGDVKGWSTSNSLPDGSHDQTRRNYNVKFLWVNKLDLICYTSCLR